MSAINIEMDDYLYTRVLEKAQRERKQQQQQLGIVNGSMKSIGIQENNKNFNNRDKATTHTNFKSPHNTAASSSFSSALPVPDLSQTSLTEEQQLVLINERIISMQQLAIIYQNQYVARRNAKYIPALFTQIVENRLTYNLKRSFTLWVETLRNEQIVNMMCQSRAILTKRKIFMAFQDNWWTACQFRNLQVKHIILTPRMHAFHAWVKYMHWCRRYNHLFQKSVIHIKKKCINAWIELKNTIFHTRNFRRNLEKIRCRETLRCLKRNVMLNKFILRTAMKTQSKLLFHETFIRRYCFQQWRKSCEFSQAIDRLEDQLEKRKIKIFFRHWKQYTSDTNPKVTTLLSQIGQTAVHDMITKLKAPVLMTSTPKGMNASTGRRLSSQDQKQAMNSNASIATTNNNNNSRPSSPQHLVTPSSSNISAIINSSHHIPPIDSTASSSSTTSSSPAGAVLPVETLLKRRSKGLDGSSGVINTNRSDENGSVNSVSGTGVRGPSQSTLSIQT